MQLLSLRSAGYVQMQENQIIWSCYKVAVEFSFLPSVTWDDQTFIPLWFHFLLPAVQNKNDLIIHNITVAVFTWVPVIWRQPCTNSQYFNQLLFFTSSNDKVANQHLTPQSCTCARAAGLNMPESFWGREQFFLLHEKAIHLSWCAYT